VEKAVETQPSFFTQYGRSSKREEEYFTC